MIFEKHCISTSARLQNSAGNTKHKNPYKWNLIFSIIQKMLIFDLHQLTSLYRCLNAVGKYLNFFYYSLGLLQIVNTKTWWSTFLILQYKYHNNNAPVCYYYEVNLRFWGTVDRPGQKFMKHILTVDFDNGTKIVIPKF